MKVAVIQPSYSFCQEDLEKNFDAVLSLLDECDDSLDLIVLPEYSDVPAVTETNQAFEEAIMKNRGALLQKAADTAKRCQAMVFVNAADGAPGAWRNTTHAFNRKGEAVGKYYKAHPAPSEVKSEAEGGHGMDVAYSYEYRKPYVLEMEGLRFGFLTCYDFYFYEYYPQLARERVDIIVGCSLQRSDSHEALSIINRFLCYQTNAYLVRASVSLGEDSRLCGCSCVITPEGEELLNMKSRVGMAVCELDPKKKFYKAAGFGGEPKAHFEYVEEGRRPWLYRNGGAAMVKGEGQAPYPRLCAHRGFSTVAPENTLPAFAAAVALGAQEIELDLWATTDGVLVSCHDDTLDRVSDGTGKIYRKSYAQLKELDFGAKSSERYRGLRIATFEQVLRQFAGRVILNLHVKIWDYKQEEDHLEQIVSLIRQYGCEQHVYFMTTNDAMIRKAMAYAPDIPCCVGWDGNKDPFSMVHRALALGAKKIQLFKPYFTKETVKLAHENGIRCNVFWSDDPQEAKEYRKMGIDTILTNDFLPIQTALQEE